MKDIQNIGFLQKKDFNLDLAKILHGNDLKDEIIKNLEIGPQEVEWINRNPKEKWADYLVYRYKFKVYPKIKKLDSFPIHLLIEPTSNCNLRCVMCFQSDLKIEGFISLDFFKNLVDQAVEGGCKALTIASRGEPTLHKDLGKMLKYCKGKFFDLKLNTNATLLSESLCYDILDSGVDIVVFSIDSCEEEEYKKIRIGGDFNKVLENIKRFCKIRNSKKEYEKTSTRVAGVHLGYQSKEKFLKFWEKIVDTVVFSSAVQRWDSYKNKILNHSSPCNQLWCRMYVWFDGTCNPCDFDYKSTLSVGNAKKTPLKEIWNGKEFNKLRKLHLQKKRNTMDICARCNLI